MAHKDADVTRIKCIIDTGVTFSGMIRTFKKESRDKFLWKVHDTLPRIEKVSTQKEFDEIHEEFCEWGVKNISRNDRAQGRNASYGQIAKTLNVVLKLLVYYSHFPTCSESKRISKFLHAAVDTPMMKKLKEKYSTDFPKCIKSIADVHKDEYAGIRYLVGRHIVDKYSGEINPVQYDDIEWYDSNRAPVQ